MFSVLFRCDIKYLFANNISSVCAEVLITEESTFSKTHTAYFLNKNCPQFGKDIIKKSKGLFL